MTWVITEPCENREYARCLEHCPVPDCIVTGEGEDQYFIDPDLCTDCGACDLSCPVAAIFPAAAVPEHWEHYIGKNAEAARRLKGASSVE